MKIVDEWLRDIPQQFQGKHNIEILIQAFSRQMPVEQLFRRLNHRQDLPMRFTVKKSTDSLSRKTQDAAMNAD